MKAIGVVVLCAAAAVAGPARAESARGWNAEAAALYLDGRAGTWKAHRETQRSHDTACISCHTGLPYLLARPALGRALGESAWPGPEKALVADVEKRTRLWSEVEPWYAHTPDKIQESRGTEAILNALVLALRDRERGETSPLTRRAFDQMWREQLKEGPDNGGWRWLAFGLAPWETRESEIWGASLAALAVTAATGDPGEGATGERAALLKAYLRRKAEEPINLHSRLGLLWASTSWKDLLSSADRARITADVAGVQRADGGFSLGQLGRWERGDGSPPPEGSDGYATGLVTYVLLQLGDAALRPAIDRGLSWLRAHEDPEGFWPAASANLRRKDDDVFAGLFMRDAASGYAVLALCAADRR